MMEYVLICFRTLYVEVYHGTGKTHLITAIGFRTLNVEVYPVIGCVVYYNVFVSVH